MKTSLKTSEVIERLGAKYPSPQYGFITQVRSGTGAYAARTADAMAMSVWPSRGLHITGFEVKVSRTDWLKELKQPEKAEELAIYCHYWYMVFGDETIYRPEEIPQKWGVMVPFGKGLKVVKEAPFSNEALPIDYIVLAGIFRNIAERCTANELIERKMDEREERGKNWAKHEIERLKGEFEKTTKQIADFESASGVRITGWYGNNETPEAVGKALKLVLNHSKKVSGAEEGIKKLKSRAENIIKFLDGEIQEYQI